jgi:hypothetical protein
MKAAAMANVRVPIVILMVFLFPHHLSTKQGRRLMHRWTLIMAIFACDWMMTSTFLSSATPINDLAAVYADGWKQIKTIKIAQVL